jgi:hypothetical protein
MSDIMARIDLANAGTYPKLCTIMYAAFKISEKRAISHQRYPPALAEG